jgi:16S rRNA (guanine527-N7)-methyltransferase
MCESSERSALDAEALGVSRETLAALERFATLLLRWNPRINLIARKDEADLWPRHIIDSLQLAPLMQPLPAHAIDLGSGAGFPGLVLALATGVPFDLVEADQRKAAFLREAARITHAPVKIWPERIEAAKLEPAPLVTARALAPLPRLLDLAIPLLSPGGVCLFPRGKTVDAELTATATQWHMQVEAFPSRIGPGAKILRISNPARVTDSD